MTQEKIDRINELARKAKTTEGLTTEELAFATDYCGVKSGRDVDKFEALGLTAVQPEVISVPGIKELPLTLECKVIYKQDQDPAAIAKENDERYYAKGTPNEGDYHTAYYGQIVSAYIVE